MCRRIHLTALLLPLLLLTAAGVQGQQPFSLSYQDYHPDTLLVEVFLDTVSPQPAFASGNTRMAYDTANLVYVDHVTEGMIFGAWPDVFTTNPDSVLVRCNPTTGACVGEANYVGTNMMNTQYLQGPGKAMQIKFAYKTGFDYDSRSTWMTVCSTRVGTAAWIYYHPDPPELLSPVGGDQTAMRPTFSWTETAGPVGTYTLEYSTSPTFVSGTVTVEDIPTAPPVESYTPGADLNPGTYYWRVTAFDHIGRASSVSDVDSFVVQACPEAPDAPETSANPVCIDSQYCLSWDHVDYAAWYDIQLNDGTWDSIGYVDEICYTQSVAGDYVYRIRARKADCDPEAGVSDPVTVTVEGAPDKPDTPILATPSPICPDETFCIEWTTVTGIDYEIRQTDGDWIPVGPGSQRCFTRSSGVYYFQIRACSDNCGCSEPSDSVQVVVEGTPDAPVVSGPGQVCAGTEYCLSWPSDPMAVNYQISTDGGATWPNGTSDTSWCVTPLAAGSVTYHVRACNTCEGCGDASSAVTVVVSEQLEAPLGDCVAAEVTPEIYVADLYWDPVAGATEYLLYRNDTFLVTTSQLAYSDTVELTDSSPEIFVYSVSASNSTCGEGPASDICDLNTDVYDHPYDLLPDQYSLSQNYPNPFNPETYIEFDLPRSSHVTLVVYNMLGQQVRTLIDEQLSAGSKTATWDGLDDRGRSVSSGVYFYRLQTTDFRETRKMVLMK